MSRAESAGESRELHRLATLTRNHGAEELRISVDEFVPNDGQSSKYISLRVWFKNQDGEFRPSKKGLTVKRHEVVEVAKVFAVLARKVEQEHEQNGGSR